MMNSKNVNQEIYSFAKKYRAIPWNVIPLFGYSKAPSAIKWREYEDRLSRDEEFEEWFTNPEVTGIGVITGKISGIVVLDEDKYKEGGVPVKVETEMLSQTARGGLHHFFKYVEPIKSSGFRKGINVEIKADGGFLVLPPTWVEIDGVRRQYEWLSKCAIEDLREIREENLSPWRQSNSNGKVADLKDLLFSPFGEQHNNLRTLILTTLRYVPADRRQYFFDYIRFEASRFDPPHPEERVEKMLKDCVNFLQKNPSQEEIEKEIQKEGRKPRTKKELGELRIEDRKLEAIAPKTGWPELDDLIKGFIPGHIYTLTGDTNVGKTTIACNFANALADQKKHTLYIALEPDVNVIEYLASVHTRKPFSQITDEDLLEDSEYVHIFLHKDIQSTKDLIDALENIQERYDLIIIDHIGYFVRTAHDWIQQQSNVIKELAFLAKENKSAVMMIAHLRKPGNQKKEWIPTQDDISGSAAFKQDSTEVMIAYRPMKQDGYGVQFEDMGVLLVTKTKTGPNGGMKLWFKKGGAKIWSDQELLFDPNGQDLIRENEHSELSKNMANSEVFSSQEDKEEL